MGKVCQAFTTETRINVELTIDTNEIFAEAGLIQPVLGLGKKLESNNKLFYSIYDNGAKAAMGNFAPYKEGYGLDAIREVFLDPMNDLVSGQMTVEDWGEYISWSSDLMRKNLI